MQGEHCLIVGGSQGLGLQTAATFAAAGYRVSVAARTVPRDVPPGVSFHAADLRRWAAARQVLDGIVDRGGSLRCAVFLQRFRGPGDPWAGELAVSLTATRRIIEHLVRRFTPEGDKGLVIVGSEAGRRVVTDQPAGYHAAKAGLAGLARYYAVALAGRGIRCNVVSPGPFVREEPRHRSAEREGLWGAITPRGRPVEAGEIARVILFLCGPDASAVTGQEITVDGGLGLLSPESLARILGPAP